MVSLRLIAYPQYLTMSERDTFVIGIEATNDGLAETNPALHCVTLWINGQCSIAWSLAIENGKREEKWFALPSGETVVMTWKMGKQLFLEPGKYTMKIRYNDRVADNVEVIVQN